MVNVNASTPSAIALRNTLNAHKDLQNHQELVGKSNTYDESGLANKGTLLYAHAVHHTIQDIGSLKENIVNTETLWEEKGNSIASINTTYNRIKQEMPRINELQDIKDSALPLLAEQFFNDLCSIANKKVAE